ncbi:MAG: hypothetical protein J7L34_07525 [Thermotogaceae bacterium]|nr:hypothetical protein [Thermotogaceae bacterium]
MRELKIFMKYGLFFIVTRRKKSSSKKTVLFGQIAVFGYFSVFTGVMMYSMLSKLKDIVINNMSLVDLYALYWNFLSGVFFLLGVIGSSVYVLSMNEEVEFLLVLPVRRWTVTFYQLFMAIFYDLPVFGMFMAVSVSYGLILGGLYPAIAVVTAIVHSLMLLTLGVYISTFVARKVTGSIARRIFIFIQAVALVGFILLLNFSMSSTSNDMNALFIKLSKIYKVLSSPFNIFGYAISSINKPSYIGVSLLLTILFGYLFVKESGKMGFVVVKGSAKKKVKYKRYARNYSIMMKDFKAIFRQDNSLFLLLYPYVFGAFMGWSVKDPLYALLVAVPISSMYALLEASQALLHDVSNWEITRSLPYTYKELISYKMFLTTGVNLLLSLALLAFTSFFGGFNPKSLWVLLIAANEFVMATSAGVYAVLSNPPKTENVSRELMKAPLWMSFITIGVTVGAIFGFGTLQKWWGLLIFIASMTSTEVLIGVYLRFSKKRFKDLIEGKI